MLIMSDVGMSRHLGGTLGATAGLLCRDGDLSAVYTKPDREQPAIVPLPLTTT